MENNKPSSLRVVLQFLRNVALIDMCLFAVVALICWISGAPSANAYANLLELAGGIVIVIGALDFMGGLGLLGSGQYQYGRSAGFEPIDERTVQDVTERRKSYRFTFQMAAVGLVSIGFGLLLQAVL